MPGQRRTAGGTVLAGLGVALAVALAGCAGGGAPHSTSAAAGAAPAAGAVAASALAGSPTSPGTATASTPVAPKPVAPGPVSRTPKKKAPAKKPKPASPPPSATPVKLTPLHSGPGTSYSVTVTHRAGEEFGTGMVRLWLPDHVGAVRGVVVGGFFPGQAAGDPRPDAGFEQLALKYHLAMVTQTYSHLDGTPQRREAYCDHGSARGLARGLAAIGGQAHHAEIATAPLVIAYGYSLAGLCAKGIAETFPARTALLIYGGMSRVDCTIPGVASIPTLIYGGGADGFVMNIPNEIPQCRAKGMPIAVALKPGAGHAIRGSSAVQEAFLNAFLPERLPLTAGGALRRIDLATGYLGDNASHTFTPYGAYRGDRNRASWLPSPAAAAAWKAWTSR